MRNNSAQIIKRHRPFLAALTALIFYSLTDILIWQRIFETNQLIEFADTCHYGWFVSLAGYAALGVFLMWSAWKDCLYYLVSLFIFAFSGLEDVLFYLLDAWPMPDSLPWLDRNPMIIDISRQGVLDSVVL